MREISGKTRGIFSVGLVDNLLWEETVHTLGNKFHEIIFIEKQFSNKDLEFCV